MINQNKLWNKYHSKGNIRRYSKEPTIFAQEVIKNISPGSKILELGCGAGNDSVYFANNGHFVTATDFSNVVIVENSNLYVDVKNLKFQVLDISKEFSIKDNSYDVIYARLSLHYFTNSTTQQIFNEIYRVLKPEGKICFMCKSVKDSIYGEGIEIEKNMFERKGHIRHFFSEEYIHNLLKNKFEIEMMKNDTKKLYERQSAFVKVIARSTK